jgi:hypothetical protein
LGSSPPVRSCNTTSSPSTLPKPGTVGVVNTNVSAPLMVAAAFSRIMAMTALMSRTAPRSGMGFRMTNAVSAEALLEEVRMLKPVSRLIFSTDGMVRNCSSSWRATWLVRSSDAPAGKDIEIATKPWSSEGMKPEGVRLASQPVSTATSTRPLSPTHLWRIKNLILPTYRVVSRSKLRLKPAKKRVLNVLGAAGAACSPSWSCGVCLSKSAARAGLSVKALTAEITMAMAIVKANWR